MSAIGAHPVGCSAAIRFAAAAILCLAATWAQSVIYEPSTLGDASGLSNTGRITGSGTYYPNYPGGVAAAIRLEVPATREVRPL